MAGYQNPGENTLLYNFVLKTAQAERTTFPGRPFTLMPQNHMRLVRLFQFLNFVSA